MCLVTQPLSSIVTSCRLGEIVCVVRQVRRSTLTPPACRRGAEDISNNGLAAVNCLARVRADQATSTPIS
jgi:hypothetical protein